MKDALRDKKRILSKNKSVKLYKKILKGKVQGFPRGYWDGREKDDGAACAQYLLEIVLKWKEEDMYKLSSKQFTTYMLGGMLDKVFEGDIYLVVNYMYPQKYYPWAFRGSKKGYWTEDTVSSAIKRNIEDRGWTREDVKKKYNRKFISEIGLEYAIKKVFKNSIYLALNAAYPEQYKEWELSSVKRSYWTNETGIIATIWMINKLEWNREDVKKKLTKKTFKCMGLEGMLRVVYNNSPYDAINAAYPGEYSRYELSVPKGYWTNETASESVRDMIENKLKYSNEQVRLELTKKDFKRFKLEYMVQKLFDGDYFKAIDNAYPGEYKRYGLKGFQFREKRVNGLVEYLKFYE